jgi:hypothetical protein
VTAIAHFDMLACRRLWASVMRTAADDLHTKNDDNRVKARAWFDSESVEIGTFLWCCDILDLNAQAVRQGIKANTNLTSHGKYAGLLTSFNRTREE